MSCVVIEDQRGDVEPDPPCGAFVRFGETVDVSTQSSPIFSSTGKPARLRPSPFRERDCRVLDRRSALPQRQRNEDAGGDFRTPPGNPPRQARQDSDKGCGARFEDPTPYGAPETSAPSIITGERAPSQLFPGPFQAA